MSDPTYIACPLCGEPCAMTAMQKRLFHGRTLTCQRCAKPFAITEQTPDPVPAPRVKRVAPAEPLPGAVVEPSPPKPVAAIKPPAPGRGEGLTPGRMALLIVLVAAVVSVLLYFAIAPSVRRSREAAHRLTCASNLTQIGSALQLYASTNGGRFPDSLDALVANGSVPPEMLICPSTDDEPALGKDTTEQAANLAKGKHLSYVYVGKGTGFGTRKAPLVYEPLTNHTDNGVHVLYTDGTVQFLPRAAALTALPQLAPGGVVPQTGPTK